MIDGLTMTPNRLYLHWSEPGGPVFTRGFPIDGGYVVFADTDELDDMAGEMGADMDTQAAGVCLGSWEPRCMPVAMLADVIQRHRRGEA